MARELTIGGRDLNATEALAAHLVGEVVAPAELLIRAAAIAERIAEAPRELLVRTKAKALRRAGYAPATPTLVRRHQQQKHSHDTQPHVAHRSM